MLIGLSGYAQTGKDTVADILVHDHGFTRVAFADKLKQIAYDVNPFISAGGGGMRRLQAEVDDFGWDKAKQRPEVRRTLQALGGSVRDHLGDDTWIQAALRGAPKGNVVITDARYPNEARAIRASGGSLVRISRPDVHAVNDHISERALDDEREWDAHLFNDSTIGRLEYLVGCLLTDLSARELV